MKKSLLTILILAALSLCLAGCGRTARVEDPAQPAKPEVLGPFEAASADEWEEVFASWNPDAPALQTLIDYVETVTDPASPDFIPVEHRVAVFDMDGTVYAELFPTYLEYYLFERRVLTDPNFTPDADMIAVAEEIRAGGLQHSYAEDMAIRHATQAARAYAGMTMDEFRHYINNELLRDADGFTGMTYGEAFYRPMIEVVDYLKENDFDVYLVSGSDRYICETLLEGMLDIPSQNIIGMDVALAASGQNGADGLDYQFRPGDTLIRTDKLQVKNLKMNKVTAIAREIGKQPVLSFGNTSGDTSMHLYTISDNPYKSAAFMLIADDADRDYGHPEKAADLRAKWESYGFHVISMKHDFLTIYGETVRKTSTFRWMRELGGPIPN